MLTLIEPPGTAKKQQLGTLARFGLDDHYGRRQAEDEEDDVAQSEDDDDFEEDDEEEEEGDADLNERDGPIQPNCLEACLAGRSQDVSDLSDHWKRDFSKRPTWFDADLALRQILKGKATGFRPALYSRILIQRSLFRAGCFVQQHAWLVIISVLALFTFCCVGLRYVHIETDIVKLWVSEGGRLNDELNFLSTVQRENRKNFTTDWAYDQRNFEPEDQDPRLRQIPEDEAPTSSYQVLIQTANPDSLDPNVLNREELLKHVRLMMDIQQLRITKFGMEWTIDDICFKPGSLDINNDSMAFALKPTLERLIPCIWITPIDCFYEGSKPLGPLPAIDTSSIPMGGLLRLLMPDIPEKVAWTNIDPRQIIEEVTKNFDMGTIMNFFLRSGIGNGYLHRPCIDPLDANCPSTAPNHYSAYCTALTFLEKNVLPAKNKTLEDELAPFRTNTMEEREKQKSSAGTSPFDILGALFGGGGGTNTGNGKSTNSKKNQTDCAEYREPFLAWMASNFELVKAEFPTELLPVYPNYGRVMEHGCRGVAQNVMSWPADMILGAVSKEESGNAAHTNNIRAEALQSVILVATPTEVFRRIKNSPKFAQSNRSSFADEWSPLAALEVIQEWARRFTNALYNHPLNEEHRVVHPLASNSISDMLAEFCDFNYTIILAGYLLMLVYALYSQCRFDGCCTLGVESAVGLALAGVLTVTLSSVAGLGVATWLGINFNAATTQIVPFLALGIGVDNMFLLLHNYPHLVGNVQRDELGFLLRETGMSILTTSLNNILAFWAGTILPIPALRSFCGQTAILLTANLVGIFFVYPAFIALDLKRRKAGRRDMAFLLCLNESIGTVRRRHQHGLEAQGKLGELRAISHKKLLESVEHNHQHFDEEDYDDDDPPYLLSKKKGSRAAPEIVVVMGAKNAAKKQQCQLMMDLGGGEGEKRVAAGRKANGGGGGRRRERKDYKWYTLEGFLHLVYIPILRRKAARFAILFFVLALFLVGLYGISRSNIGLELGDVLPEHSAPAAFLRTRDQFFSFYPMSIVLRGEHIDFPSQQHQIDLLHNEIGQSRYVVKLPNGEPSERYWLQLFREWLHGMQAKLDAAQRAGISLDEAEFDGGSLSTADEDRLKGTAAEIAAVNKTTTTSENKKGASSKWRQPSPDLQIAYSLACSYGNNYDCSRAGRVRLIDDSGTINMEGFYNYLYGWHEYEQMFYAVSQASFYPKLRKLRQGPPGRMKYRYFVPPAPKPLFSRIPFYLTGLRDTPTIVQMIVEIRRISENYTLVYGLPNHPEGVAFTFWEQYLHLDYYLVFAIAIISISVFLVISLIIFNPWAAAMVTLVVLSMTVELAGFMGLAGVKLNPISAVTLITAVGIGVEFTAHVVLAFLTSLGNRQERMVQCMEHMFVPVIHGGMSTLLGIVMLAFSHFDFVVKYFFVVMSALVIVGMLNGLALLPVLLSLVGPPCEIKPIDGGNRLKCPRRSTNKCCAVGSRNRKAAETNVRVGRIPSTTTPPPSAAAAADHNQQEEGRNA